MRSKKVSQALDAFDKFSKAQDRWNKLFNDLSEEEEAELERRLFTQGVTITHPQCNCVDKSEVSK